MKINLVNFVVLSYRLFLSFPRLRAVEDQEGDDNNQENNPTYSIYTGNDIHTMSRYLHKHKRIFHIYSLNTFRYSAFQVSGSPYRSNSRKTRMKNHNTF